MNPYEGWVYVLTNPATPQLVKIGYTTGSPKARANELSSTTGVALPYSVAYAEHVRAPARAEAEIHERLNSCRPNRNREFFQVSVPRAIAVVMEVCEPFRTEYGRAYSTRWWASHQELLSRIRTGLQEPEPVREQYRLYVCQC